MNCSWLWRKLRIGLCDPVEPQRYESLLRFESELFPGVEFSVKKISLAQRLELSSRIRELVVKNEFLRAGNPSDQLEAGISDLLVKRLYLEWAAVDIRGLRIDGIAATIPLLLESGPETLVSEISDAIHSSLFLNEQARKNF